MNYSLLILLPSFFSDTNCYGLFLWNWKIVDWQSSWKGLNCQNNCSLFRAFFTTHFSKLSCVSVGSFPKFAQTLVFTYVLCFPVSDDTVKRDTQSTSILDNSGQILLFFKSALHCKSSFFSRSYNHAAYFRNISKFFHSCPTLYEPRDIGKETSRVRTQ